MRWDESFRVEKILAFGREASDLRRPKESWYACLAVVSEVLENTRFRQCAQ